MFTRWKGLEVLGVVCGLIGGGTTLVRDDRAQAAVGRQPAVGNLLPAPARAKSLGVTAPPTRLFVDATLTDLTTHHHVIAGQAVASHDRVQLTYRLTGRLLQQMRPHRIISHLNLPSDIDYHSVQLSAAHVRPLTLEPQTLSVTRLPAAWRRTLTRLTTTLTIRLSGTVRAVPTTQPVGATTSTFSTVTAMTTVQTPAFRIDPRLIPAVTGRKTATGTLQFLRVPTTGGFLSSRLTTRNQLVGRRPGWQLVVQDTRGTGQHWALDAQATSFTDATGRALAGGPVYVGGNGTTPLSTTPTQIMTHTTNDRVDDGITDVTGQWRASTGILLAVRSGTPTGVYQGTITWTLTNAPS